MADWQSAVLCIAVLQVIAKKTTKEQLYPLIESLQEGLMDCQSHSSSGACVVLNGLMKQRGSELYEKVRPLDAANRL